MLFSTVAETSFGCSGRERQCVPGLDVDPNIQRGETQLQGLPRRSRAPDSTHELPHLQFRHRQAAQQGYRDSPPAGGQHLHTRITFKLCIQTFFPVCFVLVQIKYCLQVACIGRNATEENTADKDIRVPMTGFFATQVHLRIALFACIHTTCELSKSTVVIVCYESNCVPSLCSCEHFPLQTLLSHNV
jgi:hypothetical protein